MPNSMMQYLFDLPSQNSLAEEFPGCVGPPLMLRGAAELTHTQKAGEKGKMRVAGLSPFPPPAARSLPPLQKNRARPIEAPKVSKLPNGLTVVSQDCHGAVASLGLHILAGSRYEGPAHGTAHLLEHAAFRLGSSTRSGLKLQLDAERMGGSLSASAGREEVRAEGAAGRGALVPSFFLF